MHFRWISSSLVRKWASLGSTVKIAPFSSRQGNIFCGYIRIFLKGCKIQETERDSFCSEPFWTFQNVMWLFWPVDLSCQRFPPEMELTYHRFTLGSWNFQHFCTAAKIQSWWSRKEKDRSQRAKWWYQNGRLQKALTTFIRGKTCPR